MARRPNPAKQAAIVADLQVLADDLADRFGIDRVEVVAGSLRGAGIQGSYSYDRRRVVLDYYVLQASNVDQLVAHELAHAVHGDELGRSSKGDEVHGRRFHQLLHQVDAALPRYAVAQGPAAAYATSLA